MFMIVACLASDFLHYSCALALDAGAVILADFDICLFVRFIVLGSFSGEGTYPVLVRAQR
jgi:hypothetical protein